MEIKYYSALVCLNGHVQTRYYEDYGGDDYCDKCGARTISQCQNCSNQIKGAWRDEELPSLRLTPPPAFCHKCGKPHPWTEIKVSAAKELALSAESLDDDEQQSLADSLDDLIVDTPRTEIAIGRFKALIVKAGRATGEAIHRLLVDAVSETVKKAIWGP